MGILHKPLEVKIPNHWEECKMVKFMNTKDHCLQCGKKLDAYVSVTKDIKIVCSNTCKDEWEAK